jgi:hypothetical protein
MTILRSETEVACSVKENITHGMCLNTYQYVLKIYIL